jgi:hypothetical protein
MRADRSNGKGSARRRLEGVWHHRRMCANCVASIDAAAAAVGGVAGLRAFISARTGLISTPRRERVVKVTLVVLAIAIAAIALA